MTIRADDEDDDNEKGATTSIRTSIMLVITSGDKEHASHEDS